MRLFAIDGDDRKRVGKTKDVPLDERVGCDDCGGATRKQIEIEIDGFKRP